MANFQEMRSIVAVVDNGSFVAAAEATGQSKQAVSRQVSELEKRLGVRLLNRTTRRLSLTEDGRTYVARARELLHDIEALEAEVTSGTAEPSGRLRVNAPLTFGILHLARLWGRFAATYPEVSLDVDLSDRVVDLVEEGYDLAVRITNMPSSTLVSRQLAVTRMRLCASPIYLQEHGVPEHPRQLRDHRSIAYSYWSTGEEWTFTAPDGTAARGYAPSRIRTNSGDTCRVAALQGYGVVLQPDFLVADDIREGRLVELLPGYRGPEMGIHAVYPSRRHLPAKTRCLVDYLVDAFRSPGWTQTIPDGGR